MVEHSAVNRVVVGSSPTRGALAELIISSAFLIAFAGKRVMPFLKEHVIIRHGLVAFCVMTRLADSFDITFFLNRAGGVLL